MFDFPTVDERAAIMEFDGGMTRFDAETSAALEIGKKRWEVFGENHNRNPARGGDTGSQAQRHNANNLPSMQSHEAEQKGPLSVGDVHGQRDTGVLPSLQLEHNEVVR